MFKFEKFDENEVIKNLSSPSLTNLMLESN